MSLRLLALGAAVAVFTVWLTRPAPVTAPEGALEGRAAPSPEASAAVPSRVRLVRDPFRYEDAAPRVEVAPVPAVDAAARQEPPVVATPEPLRLSGFVRQGGRLKAVLTLDGTTVLAGAGEAAEGYRVIAVDEDAGVRLRAPSGEELLLRPAR